jgi:hypothetical protein
MVLHCLCSIHEYAHIDQMLSIFENTLKTRYLFGFRGNDLWSEMFFHKKSCRNNPKNLKSSPEELRLFFLLSHYNKKKESRNLFLFWQKMI